MNIVTPAGWAEYHVQAFGITSESDVEGVLNWAHTFTAAGIPVADLVAATDWMVVNVAPEWRREHLAHIQGYLQRLRVGRLAEVKRESRTPTAACAGCDATGFVFVPHPSEITGDVWAGKCLCVVACPCPRGAANVAAWSARERQLWSLEAYEIRFPGWREMMFRKRDHDREMNKRESEASVSDRRAGKLPRKKVERLRLPS